MTFQKLSETSSGPHLDNVFELKRGERDKAPIKPVPESLFLIQDSPLPFNNSQTSLKTGKRSVCHDPENEDGEL